MEPIYPIEETAESVHTGRTLCELFFRPARTMTAHPSEAPVDPVAVSRLLTEWRAADRRWESTAQDDPDYREAGINVLRAWLAYHTAMDEQQPGGFALVTDDDRVYVAASAGVEATLGYPAQAILGRRIEDFAAPAIVASTAARWSTFATAGRQDGSFDMLHADGSVVRMCYQARAHYPIANFHLSRLWPDPEAA